MGAPATIVLFGIQTSERAPRRSGTYLIRCDSPSNTGPRHADLPEAPICSAPHNRTLFHRLPYLTWSATLCRFVTTTPPCCPCISFILIPLFQTDTAPPHSCPLSPRSPATIHRFDLTAVFVVPRTHAGQCVETGSSELGMPGALGPVGMECQQCVIATRKLVKQIRKHYSSFTHLRHGTLFVALFQEVDKRHKSLF